MSWYVAREKVKVNFSTSLFPDIVLSLQHTRSISLQYCSTFYKEQWHTSTWRYKGFLCNCLPISYIVENYAVDIQADLLQRCIRFSHLAPSTSVSPRWLSFLWYQCAPFWYLSKSKQILKSTPNKSMLENLLIFKFACRTFTQLPFLNSTECYYFVVMLLFHFFFPPWEPPCFTQIKESQKQSLSLAQFSTCQ